MTSRTPIGLDIGARDIKAAQLNRSSRRPRLKAAALLPRSVPDSPVDQAEIQRLCAVLGRQGFSGTNAALAAPAGQLLRATLELPPLDAGAPLDQMARMEFARMHGRDPQSFELAYWMLPESPARKGRTQLIAAAFPHDEADALLDIMEQGGLNVQVLDVHPCALLRACAPLLSSTTGIVGIVDLGWNACQLLIVYHGVVVYERSLPEAGIRRLCEALSQQLHLDQTAIDLCLGEVGFAKGQGPQGTEDCFASARTIIAKHFDSAVADLRAPLSYTMQQYPGTSVARLLLVGGGASIPGLGGYLGSALGIETRTVSPADLVECPPPLLARCSTGALTAALGLAQFTK